MNMSENSNRTYRIRTNINSDSYVTFDLNQGVDVIELLSLTINTDNYYKLHTSSYGCIVGRVLANGGVGIPNAKISLFFGSNENITEDSVLYDLYPFATSFSKDSEGIRYNLLPDTSVKVCHNPVGTFPDKRLTLDDEDVNLIYEKYYTYTTRTNDAGDYMLFGVPVGSQVVHVDIDLSDIGMLSQKPYDMVYKGYSITQFENANKFKADTNLDNLTQLFTQNDTVNVYPFWGDGDSDNIKITRHDINIQYKFEPSCVFMGSIISDEKSNGVQKNCIATERMGKMDRLTTGSGTIEMVRKCADGSVEEFQVQGTQLIDGNGTWCYQIPMNLDYYMTDEYGNFVPSDENEKGIPTRTRVRFRVSMTDFQSEYANNHLSKVLIPNNPKAYEDLDYEFGSYTKDDIYGTKSFRDLFWNNVYTVKSYIPRIQKGGYNRNKRFTGIKNVNVNEGNNPIPYNNMRVNLTFMFVLQCAILKFIIAITRVVNKLKIIASKKVCSYVGDGVCPDLENWYFAPGCRASKLDTTLDAIKSDDDPQSIDSNNRDANPGSAYCITNKTNYLMQCIEINLAMEYNVIQFDFYNDWINGLLYIPRWFVNIKKKRHFLFGLIHREMKIEACMEGYFNKTRRFTQQCSLIYTRPQGSNYYTKVVSPKGCKSDSKQKCHKASGRNHIYIFKNRGGGGLVHPEDSFSGNKVYYFKPAEWLTSTRSGNIRCILFATDIVLLGSLDDYNEHGIPKAFEELSSSSYLMPSNLAATNMDKEGFMYGIKGIGGTYCTSKILTEKEMQPYEQSFENYVEWSKGTDFYEPTPDDLTEVPITESSGVDWGYSGPSQGSNNLNDLYFPGGHFLGISCFNAQTNIKSCVNLSRICEVGSIMSQRQLIVGGSNDDIMYGHLMPTGLISKYEINDGNFRKMFATMNHNGLRTKRNPNTSYLEYDFVSILPNNFNGELAEYVENSTNYNRKDTPIQEPGNASTNDLFTSTIEKTSDDYYRFRLGIMSDDDDPRNHYLQRGDNRVSMPVYENSYYFYFGLKDGDTALDRLFRDFYATCEDVTEDTRKIIVDTEATDFCFPKSELSGGLNGDGVAHVLFNDLSSPYTISLSMTDERGRNRNCYISSASTDIESVIPKYSVSLTSSEQYLSVLSHSFEEFDLTDLDSGNYTMTVLTELDGNVDIGFSVSEEIRGEMSEVIVSVDDFDDTLVSYDEDFLLARTQAEIEASGGCINIENAVMSGDSNILGFAVMTDEKYVVLASSGTTGDINPVYTTIKQSMTSSKYRLSWLEELGYNEDWKDGESYTVPAWRGNDTYNVVAVCSQVNKATTISTQHVSMATPLDIAFGDEDLTYLNTISAYTRGTVDFSVFLNLLKNTSGNTLSNKKLWNLKHTFYFRNSLFSSEPTGDINVYPFNGTPPYTENYMCRYETLRETDDGKYITDYSRGIYPQGYKNDAGTIPINDKLDDDINIEEFSDMHEFFYPTHCIVTGNAESASTIDVLPNNQFPFPITNIRYTNIYCNGIRLSDNLMYKIYNPPEYYYRVIDKKNALPYDMFLGQIYKPFFFNALKLVYKKVASGSRNIDKTIVYSSTQVMVNNPIPITSNDTEVDKIFIDGVEEKLKYNINILPKATDIDNAYFSKIYAKTIGSEISGDTIDDGYVTFKINYKDKALDENYSGNVPLMELNGYYSCKFPTEYDTSYSTGVRFFIDLCDSGDDLVSKDVDAIGKMVDNIGYYGLNNNTGDFVLKYDYSSILTDAYSVRHFEPHEILHIGTSYYEYLWRGMHGFAHKVKLTNGEYKILTHVYSEITESVYNALYLGDNTKTPWQRFRECVIEHFTRIIPHFDINLYGGISPHVLAIYDNWTRTNSKVNGDFVDLYQHVAPDTNIMSIARYYDAVELGIDTNT